jgi:hypothetical protein
VADGPAPHRGRGVVHPAHHCITWTNQYNQYNWVQHQLPLLMSHDANVNMDPLSNVRELTERELKQIMDYQEEHDLV